MVLEQLMQKKRRRKTIDIDLTPFTKIDSKWITDLNIKCKTLKLLEDNIKREKGR